MKILIVDDSSLARRTVRQMLESQGHAVTEANGGEQALEKYHIDPPELVILDMVMTGMYGLDVLAKLKELDPEARVVISTADIQKSTAEEVRAMGAKGILNKPVNRESLTATIQTVSTGGNTWN
jgi:two-component system, chemotaxis family, chemotaxis protein CheY